MIFNSKKILTLIIVFLSIQNSFGQDLSTTLKANQIDGSKEDNVISATGNVEVTRGSDVLLSDQLTYDKDKQTIKATGNIEVKGDKVGDIFASEATIKDDFSSGNLKNGQIIFDDGSYVTSPNIERKSKSTSILQNSIFSFCPNDEITKDNIKNDVGLISVKSSRTVIDKDDGSTQLTNGILRIKNVPVFYTPYLKFPLKSAKRRSGFLHPSYVNTDNLGFGFKIPYYLNIASNKDLKVTTDYYPSNKNLVLNNHFRHLTKKGLYDVKLELANNNLTATADKSSERWWLKSNGSFAFSKNVGLEIKIDHVGDKHYLRDYHNNFNGNTISDINLDHIKDNSYNSLKAVKIQELEINVDSREEINAIPVINSIIESNPGKLNEIYSLTTNATSISRRSGLQYRRLSLKPEFVIPYNMFGSIFKFATSLQGDFYSMDDNYASTIKKTEFDHSEVSYRPQASISWNLPLIKKMKKSSFIVEPKVSFVTSSYSKNSRALPNEDSNDTELTQGNLFLEDRFVGFDRNETGERVNYGFTSNLFSPFGQFGLGLGQGYQENSKTQDVTIRGFDNSKSNIVGQVSYQSPKIFSIVYNFQLNESNQKNDVNEVNTSLNFDNFNIYSNYILIKESPNNPIKREQAFLGGETKIYGNLRGYFNATKDLAEDRIIEKKMGINYNGCCVTYGFSVSESSPSQLIETEKSYNINFSIKNL